MLTDEEFQGERRARTGLSNALAANRAIRAKAAAIAEKQAKDEAEATEATRAAAEARLKASYIAGLLSNDAVDRQTAERLWLESGRDAVFAALAVKARQRVEASIEAYRRRIAGN